MNQPRHPTIHVGTVLANSYRLVRLIGEGNMSSLYEATHLRLHRRVVVKLLSRELSQDPESLARFHREADVTSALGHPHIVQVSDFGAAPSGEPYLVLEFLEGEDLEQRLRRVRRLDLPSTFRVVKQVASALFAAHDKGIVHRDLKPANIFLICVAGERDFVKVLDFGISKVQSAVTKLTQGHTVLGTPYYMSPEQATGRSNDVDHRTDQWALACITWRLLSGELPFDGEDTNALLHQVVRGKPPPLAPRVPGLPFDVEYVLLRALSKNRDDRFPSLPAFAHALKNAALASYPDEHTPTPRPFPVSTFEMGADGMPLPDDPPATDGDEPAIVPSPKRGGLRGLGRMGIIALAFTIFGVGGGALLAKLHVKSESPPALAATTGAAPGPGIPPGSNGDAGTPK